MKKLFSFLIFLFFGFNAIGQSTFINEVDYVGPATCLEIVTPKDTDLSPWMLHLYNAAGDSTDTQNITGPVNQTLDGFDFIIVDVVIFLQNNVGVALEDPAGNITQFISFGSDITANDGPAIGLSSDNIGAQGSSLLTSLQLEGTGDDLSDFTWTRDLTSCGLLNINQILEDITEGLPVELLYFTAEEQDEAVLLKWKTLAEINNDFFLIEKSQDGRNWSVVKHISGKTLSNEPIQYELLDRHPFTGINYYRLSQIDIDGTMEVFDIVSIETHSMSKIKIFPNPGSSIINIKLSKDDNYNDLKIIVRNQFRSIMSVDELSPGILDISSLKPGIYYIHVISGGNQYHLVFTKI